MIREWYWDFGPTSAGKLLWVHGTALGRETLRLRMNEARLWRTHARSVKQRVVQLQTSDTSVAGPALRYAEAPPRPPPYPSSIWNWQRR